MRRPFHIGIGWTLLWGVIAVLLSALGTQVLSRYLVSSINETLGVPGTSGYGFSIAGGLPRLNLEDPAGVELQKYCAKEGGSSKTLRELDDALRISSSKKEPALLMATVCGALAQYWTSATARDERNRLPLVGPVQDQVKVKVGQMQSCGADLGAKRNEAAANQDEHDVAWYPVHCLLHRLHAVSLRSDLWGTFLLKDLSSSGLQGSVYAYRWPRVRGEWGDPNAVGWSRDGELVDQTKVTQLTTMGRALNRLDKLLLPRIKELEDSVWLRRFLLRAFNNPFQFVILSLGIWGATLYLAMGISTTRLGRNRAVDLARDIVTMAPLGAGTQLVVGTKDTPSVAFGTEFRNAVDELILEAQTNGKSVADTLTEWVPTLGFIGTVVGMIGAMDAVGGVVGADPGPELFSAMSVVTAQLSLAFYTTFIALLAGMALSLLRRWALARELGAAIEAVRKVRSP